MMFSEEDVIVESELIVESEIVEVTSDTLYCICKQPWDKNNKKFMIQCDCCKEWFHGICVGVAEYLAKDIDKYHCDKCEISFGPSICIENNTDEVKLEKYKKPGTQVFIKELKNRKFGSMDKIVKTMRGQNLTMPELLKKGFNYPILVPDVHGLGIKLPPEAFTVEDVSHYVGPDKIVDVIDVRLQKDFQMTMSQFTSYFTKPGRIKPYNLISLEFSATKMAELVEPPYIARKLDWVPTSWPKELPPEYASRPEVSKYCLVSPEGSYTDFHVDFGGTSVWYHVLWGEKVFYFFEPTEENLASYTRWMSQTDKSAANFLGDLISDSCYECTLKKGQTLFIPTGWIHAVLTPTDSLVFGGNFLHFLNMDLQLKVYSMEKNLKVPLKYAFPNFEVTHWFAAETLVDGIFQNMGRLPDYLLRGIRALHDTLKVWSLEKEPNKSRREDIPRSVNVTRILKGLAKMIKSSGKKEASKLLDESHATAGITNIINRVDKLTATKKKIKCKKSDSLETITSNRPGNTVCMEPKYDPSTSPALEVDFEKHNPLKLKIRKQSSHSGGSSNSSPAHMYSLDPSIDNPRLEVDVSHSVNCISPPQISPPIRIRFNVSDGKAELIDSNSNTGSDALHIVESDRDELKIDTDHSNNSVNVKSHSSSRSKNKKKHHHKSKSRNRSKGKSKSKCKKKQNAERARNMTLNEELAGTLSGIEELMKSSNYTERIENCTTLKPQVKDAIKDMLEIQDEILPLKKRHSHKKSHGKNGIVTTNDDDYDMGIERVHQDDDYIYLPLAGGSDDEGHSSKRGTKRGRPRDTDVPWSPRIKVGKVSARDERPARDKAKRKSVEKGLEKASQKLSEKSTKLSHSTSIKTHDAGTVSRIVTSKSVNKPPKIKSNSVTADVTNTSNLNKPSKPTAAVKKPKKGLATPKQRLGKILGIKFGKS